MKIDTTYLKRCILALDKAYETLDKYCVEDIDASRLAEVIENSDAS